MEIVELPIEVLREATWNVNQVGEGDDEAAAGQYREIWAGAKSCCP